MLFNKKKNKKLSRFTNQNLNSFGIKVFYLFLIIILILFFSFALKPVRSFFYSVSEPVQKYFWSKGLENSRLFSGFFNFKRLKIENKSLEKENQLFLSRIVEIDELREENKKLRETLNLGLAEDFKLLEANILSRDIVKDFIVINKGTKDGIKEKMVIINYQKVLVGQIDKVYKNSSRIQLLTDRKMKFSVKIIDTDIQALANGDGNQKMILDLISKDEEVSRDALVITSGLELDFPLGLLVGKTREIEKTDLTPFQKVVVEPFFDIQTTDLIFIITN